MKETNTVSLLCPGSWDDYELIDSGNFLKLERFGEFILIRPEPQAVWDCALKPGDWERLAHADFVSKSSTSGMWDKKKKMPDSWQISYDLEGQRIKFRLALTSFKHVGVFPEQAVNWDFIHQKTKSLNNPEPQVLNLFAYTGGASLAAAKSGAQVTHVDSVKQVVNWAKGNAEMNGIQNIRWMVDDAVKFVQREIRRGSLYQGIILDPPAFGHGPSGENWKLERDINALLKAVAQLLDPKEHFLILNTYSLGFSSLIVENLAKSSLPKTREMHFGELYLPDRNGRKLPLGVFVQAST
jgi:23S rRNA (cytosine1962-C5)-methyltransferase